MSSLYVLLVATITWILWVYVAALERFMKGNNGGVSVFPAIPMFPLIAWLLAYLLNLFHPLLGITLVGGAHLLFVVAMLFALSRYIYAHRKSRT
jgi:hypothetical protein